MAGKLNLYDVGGGGVNLVKSPLQLADNEATQLQNAEYTRDGVAGGTGALSKRGGLAKLNSSALSGSVTGMLGLNLKTTYTRTLYAARGDEDTNSFMTSTDGATWTDTATPLDPTNLDFHATLDGEFVARRIAAFRNYLVYAGFDYTQNTDKPVINIWDGTIGTEIYEVPFGPSATASTPAYVITDFLVANGTIYFAVHDPTSDSGPSYAGRVLSLNLETGIISQIASAFGDGTNEVDNGYPSCLAYYQNRLWVGLNSGGTTDGIGEVVSCIPELDTTWTVDVSNLSGNPCSLAIYQGDLYAGLRSSASTNARVSRRTASTGAWTTSFTSAGGVLGEAHIASLTVYNDKLYGVDYFSDVDDSAQVDLVHIIKWDASSWTTDRDVDANDSPAAVPQLPGGMAILNDKLYVVFSATASNLADGFIMEKSADAGSWSKVATDNFAGPIAVLVTRS